MRSAALKSQMEMGSCCCSQSYDVVSYSANTVEDNFEDFEAVEVPSEEVSLNQEVAPEEDESRTEEMLRKSEPTATKRPKSLKRPLLVTIEESQVRSSYRGEKVVFEKVQTAAPPPTKRTISVEAKSTDFIVDAPQMEGIGPDGSFMICFNKFEMKNG